ncbi:cytidine/deoxycytidylate deaminase family protein, partial [Metarhizium majus ARSEF 297]
MKVTPQLLFTLLEIVETNIQPVTHEGILQGNPLFGAAILSKPDLKPITISTNNSTYSPLFHGETNCIHEYYTVTYPDAASRPNLGETIFLTTHEPCSFCSSLMAWTNVTEFYYLFTHEESRDLFGFSGDIDILENVYRVQGYETPEQMKQRARYNRENSFFSARSIAGLINQVNGTEKDMLLKKMEGAKDIWRGLHQEYLDIKRPNQSNKTHHSSLCGSKPTVLPSN